MSYLHDVYFTHLQKLSTMDFNFNAKNILYDFFILQKLIIDLNFNYKISIIEIS